MTFHTPLWFAAVVVPALVGWGLRHIGRASLFFPTLERLKPFVRSGGILERLPLILRAAALVLLAVALARPQQGLESSQLKHEGIDIALVVDVSGSMQAEDFEWHGQRRNRLDVVKEVVKEFIAQRSNDRLGLVVFGGRAYTQCPLTLDHVWLLKQLDRVEIGMVEDGTAIGSGIATGLNRLRHSKAKSRVMIVLTDGVNNAGNLSPDAAAELAKTLEVKIYTVGAGTTGLAPFPAKDVFGRTVYQQVNIPVDDEGLTRVAHVTGGQYFRATDTESLRKIYAQIDRMEKTHFEQPHYLVYREWYPWLVGLALVLILFEVLMSETVVRVLP